MLRRAGRMHLIEYQQIIKRIKAAKTAKGLGSKPEECSLDELKRHQQWLEKFEHELQLGSTAMVGLAKISTGKIEPSTKGADVPKEQWEYLLSALALHCNHQFQYDCKELLFFIDDGRANNFFGYPDE